MENCKNCKFWNKDNDNGNFGYCYSDKVADLDEVNSNDYDKFHILYGSYDDYMNILKVHKEFGCINFKEKEK